MTFLNHYLSTLIHILAIQAGYNFKSWRPALAKGGYMVNRLTSDLLAIFKCDNSQTNI